MSIEAYFSKITLGFNHVKQGDVEYLTIPSFLQAGGLIAAFTTRKGGVSSNGFTSLNFSFGREKSKSNIKSNFKIIADALNVPVEDMVLDNYGHTPNVLNATDDMRGSGVYKNSHLPTCDGLATTVVGLPLVTMHADCAPIFFYDPQKHAACVCHAGWRGVTGGIVQNALDMMTNTYGCKMQNILAAFGPCIQACCFEIKADVADVFKTEFGKDTVITRDGKMFGDIERGIAYSFMRAGMPAQNITRSGECTYCDEENYFSYRRQGQSGGAMASVVMLNV